MVGEILNVSVFMFSAITHQYHDLFPLPMVVKLSNLKERIKGGWWDACSKWGLNAVSKCSWALRLFGERDSCSHYSLDTLTLSRVVEVSAQACNAVIKAAGH